MPHRPQNPCRRVAGWTNAGQPAQQYLDKLWDICIDDKAEFDWWFRKRRQIQFTGKVSHGTLYQKLRQMRYDVENTSKNYVMVVKGKPKGRVLNRQTCDFESMQIVAIFKIHGIVYRGDNLYSSIYVDSFTHGRKKNGHYTDEYKLFRKSRTWWDPGAWHDFRFWYIGDVLNGRRILRSSTAKQNAYTYGDKSQKKELRKELYKYIGNPTYSQCEAKMDTGYARTINVLNN